jgi:hypothetical protein
MEAMRSTHRHSRGRQLLRPQLAVQLIFIALICAPLLSGAYVHVSVSYSVGSDGTIYATGVNDAGHIQMHSCWVQTTIYSPGGRSGYGYQSASSGGYAVANASLAFDQNDLGEYTIEAYGCGY